MLNSPSTDMDSGRTSSAGMNNKPPPNGTGAVGTITT
jgi:hypothetical protein